MSAFAAASSVAVLIVAFVARQEYPDYGTRLASLLVRFAATAQPPRRRERSLEEWEAELAAIQARGTSATGLVWAASLAASYRLRRLAAQFDLVAVTGVTVGVAALGWSTESTAVAVTTAAAMALIAPPGQAELRRMESRIVAAYNQDIERRRLVNGAPRTVQRVRRFALTVAAAWGGILTVTAMYAASTGNSRCVAAVAAHIAATVITVRTEDWRREVLGSEPPELAPNRHL